MAVRKLVNVVVAVTFLMFVPSVVHGQIIIAPDCELTPQSPFCQAQCQFESTLPWCTPPEPARDPIVLIPGITVSQNKKLLYEDKPGGPWKFAFGYNVYKGLIKKLETAGYEQGTDLFIAHYDWRKPAIHNAAAYLKPMIDQAKQSTGASKVDVVAHSFGGIVTRAYIQGSDYDNDVDQFITLGSPHQGSADAYVAWEGGVFPQGWGLWVTQRVEKVENALKETRDKKDLQRPESFRTFFPSLRDMLPLNDFVRQSNQLLPVTSLTEQNSILQQLHAAFSTIASKGVEFMTIAGKNHSTLNEIAVREDRTNEDIALNRWRDGHADPEPPPLDSTDGDARVLLSSAHLGSENITIDNALHHKLPDAAQDKVFELLGLEAQPSFFSDFPERLFGVTVLSPLETVIEGPNGEILSPTQNDFGEESAEYDDDPSDPDDPVEITIADPPAGIYTITSTGTGTGDYTIITSYADENETVASVSDGLTEPGDSVQQMITIGPDTSSLIDDADYRALLASLHEQLWQARKDRLLSGREWSSVAKHVAKAQGHLKLYDFFTEKNKSKQANRNLADYHQSLAQLRNALLNLAKNPAHADFADELLQIVDKIQLSSPLPL